MKITKVEIYPARDPERLKASAAVVFDDCFKVRDIFIFPRKDNSDELYVAMPVKKIKDDKRISLAHPINAEFRAEMEKAILDAYYASLEEKEEDGDEDVNKSFEDDDLSDDAEEE